MMAGRGRAALGVLQNFAYFATIIAFVFVNRHIDLVSRVSYLVFLFERLYIFAADNQRKKRSVG